jgi:hypothetical protein
MISFATFDPASLAIWVDGSLVGKGENGADNLRLLEYTLNGSMRDVQRHILELDRDRTVLAEIPSSIWHEKRHFVDILATNYGAFKFRQYSLFYASMGALTIQMQAEKCELMAPFDVYLDRVRSKVLGIDFQRTPNVVKILAKHFQEREEMLSFDNQRFSVLGHQLSFGGDAQLEAIAVLCQISSIIHLIDPETGVNFAKKLASNENTAQKYLWWTVLYKRILGFSQPPFVRIFDRLIENTHSVIPLLYASLAIRVWGADNRSYAHSPAYASVRLSAIVQKIVEDKIELEHMTCLEAWDLMNRICVQIWGRSAIDEIRSEHETAISFYGGEPIEAIKDYLELRERMIERLELQPESILNTSTFCKTTLQEADPIIVHIDPSGKKPIDASISLHAAKF